VWGVWFCGGEEFFFFFFLQTLAHSQRKKTKKRQQSKGNVFSATHDVSPLLLANLGFRAEFPLSEKAKKRRESEERERERCKARSLELMEHTEQEPLLLRKSASWTEQFTLKNL
jgi:hypothetical protein